MESQKLSVALTEGRKWGKGEQRPSGPNRPHITNGMTDSAPTRQQSHYMKTVSAWQFKGRLSDGIKEQVPTLCCLPRTCILNIKIQIAKTKGWRYIYHPCTHQKKVGMAILTSDKVGFRDIQ